MLQEFRKSVSQENKVSKSRNKNWGNFAEYEAQLIGFEDDNPNILKENLCWCLHMAISWRLCRHHMRLFWELNIPSLVNVALSENIIL